MRDDRFSIDIPKRWVKRAVITLAVGMLVLPAAAWAGNVFDDVPNSNIFHDDISWMAEEGVTVGCNPPENTEYCPDENVTREQMAAFLHRMDTRDVFVTPMEADLNSHFAVIDADGTTIATDNVDGAERIDAGSYAIDFAAPIGDCSWTGALGARNGSPITSGHTLTLNEDPAENDRMLVEIVNDDGTTQVDHDFNVTVTCNR